MGGNLLAALPLPSELWFSALLTKVLLGVDCGEREAPVPKGPQVGGTSRDTFRSRSGVVAVFFLCHTCGLTGLGWGVYVGRMHFFLHLLCFQQISLGSELWDAVCPACPLEVSPRAASAYG